MLKKEKILVTGAYGLVGSALVQKLKSEGFIDVIAVGRSNCNLINFEQTLSFFKLHKPKYVFHAAAKVYGILGNMENKGLSFFDNVMINTNVIEASRLVGVQKITAMGTGAIYPFPPASLPLKESEIFYGLPHPSENSYAHAKRAMLAMLDSYKESYGLDWAYIVSCNLFGPRDKFDTNHGHVIPSLIKKFFDAKKNNSEVIVWGNGSAQRDFLYVKDVSKIAIKIMDKISGPVNIGSGQVMSIKDIVEALASLTGMQERVVWDESKPNGQDYRAYDLTIINKLGFTPEYDIHHGLKETWDWYCENNK